jgi:magnesium transporter
MIRSLAMRGNVCEEFALGGASARLKDPEQVVWIDLADPDQADFEFLRREFGFHELALEDASHHNQRPKIDEYQDFYFLVVYTVGQDSSSILWRELDIFLGRNYMVTVHDGEILAVGETQKRWANNPTGIASKGAGELLYVVLDAIVDQYFPVIDTLSDRVDDLEEAIFSGTNPQTLSEIFTLRKDMMQLRRIIAPAREVVNTLLRRDIPVIEEAHSVYYQDVYDHMIRIIEQVDTLRDLLNGALDAHLAMSSNRLNQTMRRLTAWTIILMSMALIAGIYGMNFELMPELTWPLGYLWSLGLMAFTAILLYGAFKRSRWL